MIDKDIIIEHQPELGKKGKLFFIHITGKKWPGEEWAGTIPSKKALLHHVNMYLNIKVLRSDHLHYGDDIVSLWFVIDCF